MMRSLRLLTLATCAVGLGCDGEGLAPEQAQGPGPLELQVVTPNADDGALLIAVSGGPVDSITSSEFEVAMLEISPRQYRMLIRGPVHSGSVAQLWVPDRGRRFAYVSSIAQAVSRGTYQRRAVADYGVSVGRASVR
jgi:hypothetical protein